MKQKCYIALKYIILIVGATALTLLTLILHLYISGFFQPEGTFFYVLNKGERLFLIIEIIYLILLERKIFSNEAHRILRFIKIGNIGLMTIVVLIIGFWCVNQTYISGDTLLVHSTWDWRGDAYTYEDVIGIETGFDKESTFYYIITLVDGTKIDLTTTGTINEEVYDDYDTYVEIYDFDLRVMEQDIPKISVLESMKYCDYDPVYYERCEAIIMNQ